MNLSITFLGLSILLFLYVPGTCFKRAYFQGVFFKQFLWGSFFEKFVSSIVFGILIHSVISIFYFKFACTYNSVAPSTFSELYNRCFEVIENIAQDHSNVSNIKFQMVSSDEFIIVFQYWILSIVVSIFLGALSFSIIRTLKLDLKFKILRFKNYWEYYFSGEILRIKGLKLQERSSLSNETSQKKYPPKIKKFLTTKIDILMNKDCNSLFYSGILAQYSVSEKESQLEFLYLADSRRYSTESKDFKDIPGHILVIPYSHVANINITYIYREIESSNTFWKKVNLLIRTITIIIALLICFIIPVLYYERIGLIRTISVLILSIGNYIFLVALIGIIFGIGKLRKSRIENIFLGIIISIIITFLTIIIFNIFY